LITISAQRALSNMCQNCSSLTSVSFPKLSSINSAMILWEAFYNCSSLSSLSFPALKSTSFGNNSRQFRDMLRGVTGCTVHFPSNLQSVIGSWEDVVNGFNGTNTVVSFDLPSTS